MLSRIFILIAAIALGLPLAEACRYSVRDVGFADLGNERYTLRFYVEDPETPDAAGALVQAARTLFGDSNVIFEVAKREPGREGLVLVSPDGKRSHSIAWPGLEAGAGEPEWDLAQSIIASPTRDALLEKLIPAYAVVLLVDGTDAAQTKRAHTAAVEAIEAITKLMPEMPKPVEHPPVVVRLPVDRMAEETILLWSLGLDTSPTPEPQAVVVMGHHDHLGEVIFFWRGEWVLFVIRAASSPHTAHDRFQAHWHPKHGRRLASAVSTVLQSQPNRRSSNDSYHVSSLVVMIREPCSPGAPLCPGIWIIGRKGKRTRERGGTRKRHRGGLLYVHICSPDGARALSFEVFWLNSSEHQ